MCLHYDVLIVFDIDFKLEIQVVFPVTSPLVVINLQLLLIHIFSNAVLSRLSSYMEKRRIISAMVQPSYLNCWKAIHYLVLSAIYFFLLTSMSMGIVSFVNCPGKPLQGDGLHLVSALWSDKNTNWAGFLMEFLIWPAPLGLYALEEGSI